MSQPARDLASLTEALGQLAREEDGADLPEATIYTEASARARLVDLIEAELHQDRAPAPVVPLNLARPRPRRRARRWALGALAIATAAAVTLVLTWPRTAPLPSYELTLEGGQQTFRHGGSGAPETPTLDAGARVEIALAPSVPVEGEVAARAWLVREGRSWPWPGRVDLIEGGGVRFMAAVEPGHFHDGPGTYRVLVVVARDASALASERPPAASAEVLHFTREVRFTSAGPR